MSSKKSYNSFSEYKSYRNMIRNCYPSDTETTHYEINNIKVHPSWLPPDGFKQFLEDLGTKPSEEHKLCRINPLMDFEPNNCCWCTSPNRKDSIIIEHNNKKQTLKEWCLELDTNYWKVYNRIKRYNHKKTPQEILDEICQG